MALRWEIYARNKISFFVCEYFPGGAGDEGKTANSTVIRARIELEVQIFRQASNKKENK
jgi:hypothetical protein